MIITEYNGHDYKYDLDNVINIFLCEKNIKNDYILKNDLKVDREKFSVSTFLYDKNGNEIAGEKREFDINTSDKVKLKKLIKNSIKLSVYDILVQKFDSKSKWGILVGIRPVKIIHEILDNGGSFEDAIEEMRNLRVSDEKIKLALSIAKKERKKIYPLNEEISLYISIPFCPSRCYYCSFPSNDINNGKFTVESYIEVLKKEISEIGKLRKKLNLNINCIYFGGGTPSVLTDSQIVEVFEALKRDIGLKDLKEFTFEAGRPDTITSKKLEILIRYGVDRICLNPQTFNDKTLVSINRRHTVDDFYRAYELIKTYKFKSINFDLILGLKDENFDDMKYSLEEAVRLKPENITVHTLSVKRSSKLNEFFDEKLIAETIDVENAVNLARKVMFENGYEPYYMYRQKKMIGNLENVGYSKNGFESLYNMRIMEERHTIIALGAGSSSKICYESENKFERHGNPKGLDVYLSNIDKYLNEHIYLINNRYSKLY